jgi:hypothetical protein
MKPKRKKHLNMLSQNNSVGQYGNFTYSWTKSLYFSMNRLSRQYVISWSHRRYIVIKFR